MSGPHVHCSSAFRSLPKSTNRFRLLQSLLIIVPSSSTVALRIHTTFPFTSSPFRSFCFFSSVSSFHLSFAITPLYHSTLISFCLLSTDWFSLQLRCLPNLDEIVSSLTYPFLERLWVRMCTWYYPISHMVFTLSSSRWFTPSLSGILSCGGRLLSTPHHTLPSPPSSSFSTDFHISSLWSQRTTPRSSIWHSPPCSAKRTNRSIAPRPPCMPAVKWASAHGSVPRRARMEASRAPWEGVKKRRSEQRIRSNGRPALTSSELPSFSSSSSSSPSSSSSSSSPSDGILPTGSSEIKTEGDLIVGEQSNGVGSDPQANPRTDHSLPRPLPRYPPKFLSKLRSKQARMPSSPKSVQTISQSSPWASDRRAATRLDVPEPAPSSRIRVRRRRRLERWSGGMIGRRPGGVRRRWER